MKNEIDFKKELEIQKKIAYTAGLLQGDVTIKTLIGSLAEGVVFINSTGRIILINDRLSEMTAYDQQEVMGQSLNVFIPGEFHKKHDSHISEFFSDPYMRSMGIGMELVAKRKDGSVFPIEISLSFLDTDSGRLGIAFLTDITSRKKAENELKERNLELDAYAHTVAHDLNASVSGIVGLSELLVDQKDKLSKQEFEIYLNDIAQGGRKMTSIIRELLLFASMKKEDLELQKINMKEIIDSACERLKYQINEKNAKIEVSDNMLDCFGYSLWVEEVWLNFISNAVKYGGIHPKIRIFSAKAENGYIKYSIMDEGEGISEELKTVIFKDRDKTKDRFTKGFGLGLSIVKRIVEKLDGYVSAESELGKGSVFSFYLREQG